MTRIDRFVGFHIAAGVVVLLAGLLGLDQAIAESLHSSGWEDAWLFRQGTVFLDTITGKEISKFLVGFLLIGGSIVLLASAQTRLAGGSILFAGAVQLFGTLVTGVSKNAFGRLRPFQLIESGDWSHAWFVGGSSFPSGHAGFYFGLFLPLAYLFPRWRWPLMLTPWFIAVARVNANHHFVSDVAASVVLVGIITLLCATLTKRSGRTLAAQPWRR
jgi:membrane-associated phospholipid phosphatase